VSTVKQDLDRQIEALVDAGVARERIYVDKKSGATVDRPGLRGVVEYAREEDAIVVHTLDRLGRTVRDTLNMIHELSDRGIGVRNLADPIRVDSSRPEDPMAQLAVVLLALFARMERTYTIERAAHARAVAAAKGRRVGRPVLVASRHGCGRSRAPAASLRSPCAAPPGRRASRPVVRAVEQPRIDVVAHVHDVDAVVARVGEGVHRGLQEEEAGVLARARAQAGSSVCARRPLDPLDSMLPL
jgi:DNA invertase Pin-like site-specific DNA recombinase